MTSQLKALGMHTCLILLTAMPAVVLADQSSRVPQMTLGEGSKTFRIAIDPGTFPPFTSGPFEGIDFEVLKAVCEANTAMKCKVQLREFSECSVDGGVGDALEKGKVDGCMNWVNTAPRAVEGFEFAEPYHTSSAPQLVCDDDPTPCQTMFPNPEEEEGGVNLMDAKVGFVSGFFAAPGCLNDVYDERTYKEPVFVDSLTDLGNLLNDGDIDYGFWDTTTPLPEGLVTAGPGVPSCGSENSLLLYPPSKKRSHKSDALRRAWNCGLAKVRHTPELLENLLTALETELDRQNPPDRSPLEPEEFIQEGPLPTAQCLQQESGHRSDDDD